MLLVQAALGTTRGAASMGLYLGEAAAGLPFFAEGTSGAGVFSGATGGYLVEFVFAAALVGFLAQRGWDRRFASALAAISPAAVDSTMSISSSEGCRGCSCR